MAGPSQALLLDSVTRQVLAAADLYAEQPYLSCDRSRVIKPSLCILKNEHRTVILVAAAPNDPRALPLVIEAFQAVRSTRDLLILSAQGTQKREHTIPGVLAAVGTAQNIPQAYPFITIANVKLLNKVVERCQAVELGFTREQLIGGIVSNAAISDKSSIMLDTLGGANRLLKAWNNKFPIAQVLEGAFELQDPLCHSEIIDCCQSCICACVDAARAQGINVRHDNPDFIQQVIDHAKEHYPQLSEKHILGYAVCYDSAESKMPVPNFVHSILKAYATWQTEVPLQEIYQSVVDWLTSHRPDFGSVISDNAKISKIVQQVDHEVNSAALKQLLQDRTESLIIGFCSPSIVAPFSKSFESERLR